MQKIGRYLVATIASAFGVGTVTNHLQSYHSLETNILQVSNEFAVYIIHQAQVMNYYSLLTIIRH